MFAFVMNEFHDKNTLSRTIFTVADLTKELDFDKKYDAVVSLDVIEHIDNKLEFLNALKRFANHNTKFLITFL